jgi:hypothetical protein
MFGRWDKKREAAIEARLEAVELTLLALLPELSPESQAVVRSRMAHFVERAVSNGPPSSLVPPRYARHFCEMLSERMHHMIAVMDQDG